MKEAIERAIEGGWFTHDAVKVGKAWHYDRSILLDPLFWQSLGKAMGWGSGNGCPICEEVMTGRPYMFDWQKNWHRFIDHLAEGEDIDSFFNELLK